MSIDAIVPDTEPGNEKWLEINKNIRTLAKHKSKDPPEITKSIRMKKISTKNILKKIFKKNNKKTKIKKSKKISKVLKSKKEVIKKQQNNKIKTKII